MKDYIGLYTQSAGMMPKPNTEIIKIIKSIPRTSARGKQSMDCYIRKDALYCICGIPMVSKWVYQLCLIK